MNKTKTFYSKIEKKLTPKFGENRFVNRMGLQGWELFSTFRSTDKKQITFHFRKKVVIRL